MPSITIDDFKIGKDSRKGPSVSDADRLLELTNAFITTGKVPRKREGTGKDVSLETGSVGLVSANNKLNTFYGSGSLSHADPDYVANLLNATVEGLAVFIAAGGTPLDDMSTEGIFTGGPTESVFEVEIDLASTPDQFKWRKDGGSYTGGNAITGSPQALSDGVSVLFAATTGHNVGEEWTFGTNVYNTLIRIHFADVFLGFLYVSAEYDTGLVRHHYLDNAANSLINDVNCPNSKGVIKMVDKIFAVNGDTVNFSKTADPRNWTEASNAGFMSTGLKQSNAEDALGLGAFGKQGLVVVHDDGAQLWNVDPDPDLIIWERNLDGFASRFPRSIRAFAGDLFVLSDNGVRSVSEAVFTENLEAEDVGSPIDKDITAVLTDTSDVFAARYNKGGQYWLVVDSNVFVYTFSRTEKISAWSVYTYPFTFSYMAEFRGNLYLRSGNDVYIVDKSLFEDDGTEFEALIQTAFLNAKTPGLDKQWWGLDAITQGTAEVSHRYDPNNVLGETSPLSLTNDTNLGNKTPVEVIAPSLSTIFKNKLNEEFQLDSFTLYYEELTVQ